MTVERGRDRIALLAGIIVLGFSILAQGFEMGAGPSSTASPSASATPSSSTTPSPDKTPQPMHWGGDHSFYDRANNFIKLRGNTFLFREDEEVFADEMDIDFKIKKAHARGHVIYQFQDTVVHSNVLDLNLDSHTGIIYNGNVSNGKTSLRGTEIRKLGEGHYRVFDYDYSTCRDCPNSWTISGQDVDLTVDGYAFIKNFLFKIKDASLFWLPYMILPMKTRRQSGLLFPRFGVDPIYGTFIVEPFFWAINDWSDATAGVGFYAARGLHADLEGRYMLTTRSRGTANLYWTKDTTLAPSLNYRYAGKLLVTQELPAGFEGKLRLLDVSDSGYPIDYSNDIMGRFDPVLTSELFLSRNDPNISSAISIKRFRNLLHFDSNNNYAPGFDSATVQEYPRVVVNTNDQFIFGSNFAGGIEARFNRFARFGGPVDNGIGLNGLPFTAIREANRFTLVPNLYTTLNPFPWLSLVPSISYHGYFYNFSDNYPDLERGYLLAQAETSFQIEKIYNNPDSDSLYKHTFRPRFVYSVIPTEQETVNHPFTKQILSTANPGQYFDNEDIVPLGASQSLESYFTPLGNSLTYGLTSQLFRKRKSDTNNQPVSRIAEFNVYQTWDIRETFNGGIKLSPLFSQWLYEDRGIRWYTEYNYYFFMNQYNSSGQLVPNAAPNQLNTNLSWIFAKGPPTELLLYERSVGLNYTFSKLTSSISSVGFDVKFSINDYLMPSASIAYNLVAPTGLLDSRFGMLFQSPSQCWRLDTAITKSVDRGLGFQFNLLLNLNGTDFGTPGDQAAHIN